MKKFKLLILLAGLSVIGNSYCAFGDIVSSIGKKCIASAQWVDQTATKSAHWTGRTVLDIITGTGSTIKTGVKKGTQAIITETVKEAYKEIILKNYIIRPIQKRLGLDKGHKQKAKVNFIDALSKRLQMLKEAGADEEQIQELAQKITDEYEAMLHKLMEKK